MKEILQFTNQHSRPLHISRDSLLLVFNSLLQFCLLQKCLFAAKALVGKKVQVPQLWPLN